jgi:hypothetical protein
MSRTFKFWILGVVFQWIFAVAIYYIGIYVNPDEHLSLLETWAITNIILVFIYGISIYNKEDENIYIN